MTYVLACLLCAGGVGDVAPRAASRTERLTLPLTVSEGAVALGGDDLHVSSPEPLRLALQTSGPDDSTHMGPMWVMMAVMIVGMMVVAGVYMMRGHHTAPMHATAVGSHQQLAAFPATPFRPGG